MNTNTPTVTAKITKTINEYAILTVATLPMIIGVSLFKYPNSFTFAGVTGISVVLSKLFAPLFVLTPATYNLILNGILLLLAFILIGRSFGIKTVYVTLLSSFGMKLVELIPFVKEHMANKTPISGSMGIDLVFAIVLPAVSTAILFNYSASAGGTEIVGMIIKKHSNANTGIALLIVDSFVTLSSYFVFGLKIGLYSTVGLLAKTFVINYVLDNLNLCKFFTIICENPAPICKYIQDELHRTSTIQSAEGWYSHHDKTIVLTVMDRRQGIMLRNFVKKIEPHAFIMITDSSEIVGNDFHVHGGYSA